MSVTIGLIGDVHATAAPLRQALAIFRRAEVAQVLCTGDVAGYGHQLEETVALLRQSDCRTVLGNHDLWWCERQRDATTGNVADYLSKLPRWLEINVGETRLCMVHASPADPLMEGIRLLDEKGDVLPGQRAFWSDRLRNVDADVLVVGHTHQVFAEQLGHPLVVNPGSSCLNHTCAILTLPECQVEFLALGGKTPMPSWNWRMGVDELLQPNGGPA